jgi:hypothetical protein
MSKSSIDTENCYACRDHRQTCHHQGLSGRRRGSEAPRPAAEAVTTDAQLKGLALPADKPGKFAAGIHLDSLGVIDLLCGLEPVVGFELKDSLVKAGGYKSINDAVEHLMPRIEKAWSKNGSAGGKK